MVQSLEDVTALLRQGSSRVEFGDELEALSAIYSSGEGIEFERAFSAYSDGVNGMEDWSPSSGRILRVLLSTTITPAELGIIPLQIVLSIPSGYPDTEPPQMQLKSQYIGPHRISSEVIDKVTHCFVPEQEKEGQTCSNKLGAMEGTSWSPKQVCLYDGIEWVRDLCTRWFLHLHQTLQKEEVSNLVQDMMNHFGGELNEQSRQTQEIETVIREDNLVACPTIISTKQLVDKKSVFVGHAARVKSLEEIQAVMRVLLSDKKIARATHNISAYRFSSETGVRFQDNDDDGESAAGSRLAHLLTLLNVEDVLVVVSRWYGGVQLGADRFKDINSVAREALQSAGFLESKQEIKKKKQHGKT